MNKKKKMFTGWTDVCSFTVKQVVSQKSFKIITVIISLIALLSLSAINVIVALVNAEDEDAQLTMKNVFVLDETEMINDDFQLLRQMYPEETEGMEINLAEGKIKEIQEKHVEEKDTVIIHIYEDKADEVLQYKIEMQIPEYSHVKEESGSRLLDLFENYFNNMKLVNSGIETEKLMTILSPVDCSVSLVGEESDTIGEEIVKMVVPMLFVLLFYMMLLLYGQTISKCIIAEKTSKLMETMLTTIKPYAIITGKVIGMAGVAVCQLILWVFMGIAGFIIGDKIAARLTPGYSNIVLKVINLVREDAGNAFSIPSLILFVVTMCAGFIMYCIFAAMLSSSAKRAEELNSSLSVYNLLVVAGFLISYMVPMNKSSFEAYIDYIPPFAAFKLPTDALLGKIGYGESLIFLGLIVITSFILTVITGKIYKKKVF